MRFLWCHILAVGAPAACGLLLSLPARLPGGEPVRVTVPQEPDRLFLERVKPLLDSRCVSCHGPDKVKGNLRLDTRDALLKGGESGQPSVVPGKPEASLLLQAVTHSRKDLEMPPKEKLTAQDIAVLTRWVQEGAPWPVRQTADAAVPPGPAGELLGDAWRDPRNPIRRLFGGQRLELWSLHPRADTRPPAVRHPRWARNDLDRFFVSRREAAGLPPVPEADRRTLARRLHLDLTGLPPSPEEMDRFLADPRPDAYEQLVDHLLESPRFGEHWARLWLDAVRYSDSNGFDWDEFRPMAWRFRDYVIRSFNADKPMDRFIREQLAGDELVPGPARSEAERDALIATGYLRLGPHDNSAPAFNEQDRSRAELMADLTETTGSAFLGLTLSCCRCHDHKFDPLSQADHYRLRAFFEGVKFADSLPLDLAPEQEAIRRENEELNRRRQPVEVRRARLLELVRERLRAERRARLAPEEQALLQQPTNGLPAAALARLDEVRRKTAASDMEVKAALSPAETEEESGLAQQLENLQRARRPFSTGLLMTDRTDPIPVTRVLFQGNHTEPRDPVVPGFPSALDPNPALIRPPAHGQTSGRRLALANWIVSPINPLTSRVLVNRVWQGCFGRGLVPTPNDFGLAGDPPARVDVLDWLAGEFLRGGWSLKRLQRLFVTSALYREAPAGRLLDGTPGASQTAAPTAVAAALGAGAGAGSDADRVAERSLPPAEVSLATGLESGRPLRRLSAEQLRDAVLAVSGMLVEKRGGPPVWPELPPEILQANPAFLDDNAEKTKGWYPSPAGAQPVRSIYLVQKRTVRVPFLEAFDQPENSVSCARRTVSVVAPQAFSLLNSPLAVEAARAMATRVRAEAGAGEEAQVIRAFQRALQRNPSPPELAGCRRLLRERSLAEVCRVLFNLNEFAYAD